MKRNKTLVRRSTIACICKTSVIVWRESSMHIKNSISILFIIHEHFVSMFCSFVFIYSSTLLQFAICKNSSNNRLQIIAILRLFLIFLATLCTFVKGIATLMCSRLQYALLIAKLWKIAIHIGKTWLFSNSYANLFEILWDKCQYFAKYYITLRYDNTNCITLQYYIKT